MSNKMGERATPTIHHVRNDNVQGAQQLDALLLAGILHNSSLQRHVRHQSCIIHQGSLGANLVARIAELVNGGGPFGAHLIQRLLPVSKDTLKLGAGHSLEVVRGITWQRGREALELLQLLKIT